MRKIADYIAEAHREVAMRRQVYPGRVSAKKMTQAQADKKIILMQQVGVVFHIAQLEKKDPWELRLPLYEPDGEPFPITTLAPHIQECETELKWREHLMSKQSYGRATTAIKRAQIETLREMLAHLIEIQTASQPAASQATGHTAQTKLF